MKRRFFLPLIGYLIGWFYWKTVLGPWPTLLFVAAFFAWGIATGWEKQNRGPMHYLWAGVTALIGLAITTNRCHATADWSTLALHFSAGLWMLSYLGADRGGEDALSFAWDCADAFLLLPFGNFFGRITDTVSAFAGLLKPRDGESGKTRRRDFYLAVLCLVLALPLLVLVTNLLGEADAGFENLIQGFRLNFRMSENFVNECFWFLLGLPWGPISMGSSGALPGGRKPAAFPGSAWKKSGFCQLWGPIWCWGCLRPCIFSSSAFRREICSRSSPATFRGR